MGHDALLFSTSGTRSFICPVSQSRLDMPTPLLSHGSLGESQSAPAQGRFETPTCHSTVEHASPQTTMTVPRITPGPERRDLFPIGGSSAKTAPPHVCHPQGVRKSTQKVG